MAVTRIYRHSFLLPNPPIYEEKVPRSETPYCMQFFNALREKAAACQGPLDPSRCKDFLMITLKDLGVKAAIIALVALTLL